MLSNEEILRNLIGAEVVRKDGKPVGYRPLGSPLIIEFSGKKDFKKVASIIMNKFNVVGIKSVYDEDRVALLFLTDLDTACPFEVEVFEDMMIAHFKRVPLEIFKSEDYIKTVRKFVENVKKFIDENPKVYYEGG